MKGLNDMEFNIGDVVRIGFDYVSKRFVGTIGITHSLLRLLNESLLCNYPRGAH